MRIEYWRCPSAEYRNLRGMGSRGGRRFTRYPISRASFHTSVPYVSKINDSTFPFGFMIHTLNLVGGPSPAVDSAGYGPNSGGTVDLARNQGFAAERCALPRNPRETSARSLSTTNRPCTQGLLWAMLPRASSMPCLRGSRRWFCGNLRRSLRTAQPARPLRQQSICASPLPLCRRPTAPSAACRTSLRLRACAWLRR